MNSITETHEVMRSTSDTSKYTATATSMRGEYAKPLIEELRAAGYQAWDNYSGACNWPRGLAQEGEHIHASQIAITGLSEADVRYLLKRKRRGS